MTMTRNEQIEHNIRMNRRERLRRVILEAAAAECMSDSELADTVGLLFSDMADERESMGHAGAAERLNAAAGSAAWAAEGLL